MIMQLVIILGNVIVMLVYCPFVDLLCCLGHHVDPAASRPATCCFLIYPTNINKSQWSTVDCYEHHTVGLPNGYQDLTSDLLSMFCFQHSATGSSPCDLIFRPNTPSLRPSKADGMESL